MNFWTFLVFTVFLVFILINPNVSYQKVDCGRDLVDITKYNGKQYCVKPTSFYTLLDRGWASHADNDTENMSKKVVENFIFSQYGWASVTEIEFSSLEITQVAESYPEQYYISVNYLVSQPAIDWIIPEEVNREFVISDGKIIAAINNDFPGEPKVIDGEFVLDEVLVRFEDRISESNLLDIVSSCNTEIKDNIVDSIYLLIITREGQTVQETISCFKYDQDFYVVNAEPNYIYKISLE